MTRLERGLLASLAVVVLGFLINFYSTTTIIRHLDSVFLFESITSIQTTGKPLSASVASWPPFVDAMGVKPELVCTMPLGYYPPYNVYDNHAYTALYPLALLATVTGAEGVFSLGNALAFVALLLVPYVLLRQQGLALVPALAFALLVLCYPGWSQSAIGDYYLDRLYMPCMLLLLYVLHQQLQQAACSKQTLILIVGLALFTASFTERAAIMVLATFVFYLLLFPAFRRNRTLALAALAVCAVLMVYLWAYYSFFYEGIEGAGGLLSSTMLSWDQWVRRAQNPNVWIFLFTNFLFLGWCALFAGWRYVLLVAGSLVPNLLISVGGAELVGWTTHYHSMYIPFLVFAASIGFLNVNRFITVRSLRHAFPVVAGIAVIIFAYCYDPATGVWSKQGVRGSFGLSSSVYRFYLEPELSNELAMVYWLETLAPEITEGAKVSSVEGTMPALYKGRQLALYPMGMDEADYLVVSGYLLNGEPTGIAGAANDWDTPQVNACMAQRAKDQGFVLFKDLSPVGALVFKRGGN